MITQVIDGKVVRKHTEEELIKMSVSQIGEKNHRFGKKCQFLSDWNKENISALRDRMKGENNPNYRGACVTEEWREKQSISHTGKRLGKKNGMFGKTGENHPQFGIPKSYETRMRIVESRLRGFWYGNVRYYPENYCELWEDVNPRVHAFFNYECCLCHVPENGRSHIGHHVFYVKNACCWQTDDGVYYTNLNANDHIENDYYIGKNPNYFVILCWSCHGKTQGNFKNRKKWANHFRKLIDEEYDGVCYLQKEDYEEKKL